MPLSSHAPTGTLNLSATSTPIQSAISSAGSPTTALVVNGSSGKVFVLLASSIANALLVSPANGVPIPPNSSVPLTIGANTNIGVLGTGSVGQSVSISLGV